MYNNNYGYVYSITNIVNGKIYIGQTVSKHRKHFHLYQLRKNTHGNIYLQRSFNKYGEKAFKFQIITHADNKEELDKLEKEYIIKAGYPDFNKCYNIREGGSNGKPSEKSKQKQSKSLKKYYETHTPYFTGKKFSKEHRLNISKAKKGIKRSEEATKKMVETRKSNYKPYTLSKVTKKRMGAQHKKYTLWNGTKVWYNITNMYQANREPNPCHCFHLRYDAKFIKVGTFIDFITPEMLYDIVKEEDIKQKNKLDYYI